MAYVVPQFESRVQAPGARRRLDCRSEPDQRHLLADQAQRRLLVLLPPGDRRRRAHLSQRRPLGAVLERTL